MIKTEAKTINGVTYKVNQFPAREALRLKVRIGKMLAPLISGGKTNLSNIANQITGNLDDESVINLVLDLLRSTTRDGKELRPEVFDVVYAGNFGELFEAIKFVMEVNYKDFLDKLKSLTGNRSLDQGLRMDQKMSTDTEF